jgi:Resolvase, N terminal domain
MILQNSQPDPKGLIVFGYVIRSSEMQKDNYSIDAQKRAIREACKLRGLPESIFYEDDERSARGEQIAKRPPFKKLLDDVVANRGRAIVMMHTLDRWSRNVMVTLQSFPILSQNLTPFVHCGLNLRCDTGNTPENKRTYYRDAAKARKIPCPAGGFMMVRIDVVHEQFEELLKSLTLPDNWGEEIRWKRPQIRSRQG